MNSIQLVECPRDAMQGWEHIIATEQKVRYINALLRVGFHTIDFGSFVSARAIPQMADTKQVVEKLEVQSSGSKLLAIVANARGAEEAIGYEKIHYLGFPFSISPTFQLRNTNSSIEASVKRVDEIQNFCKRSGKELVIYLSMGFGNPYGDNYNEDILMKWAEEMVNKEIHIISLADTVGLATPVQISFALNNLIPRYPNTTFGVHLHSTAENWRLKLHAALEAGCTRIDGALKGIGGCPMAANELVGNMNMENIIDHLEKTNVPTGIDKAGLEECLAIASEIFV